MLGLRARGGYEVDISWSANAVTKATIRSYQGTTPNVRIKGQLVALPDPRITVQYVTTGIAPMASTSLDSKVKVLVQSGRYRVENPYPGAYKASLLDLQGRVLGASAGNGPGVFEISAPIGRSGPVILDLEAAHGLARVGRMLPLIEK